MQLIGGVCQKLCKNRALMALHVPIRDHRAVNLAVDLLKSDCVVSVPTDTVYGLACDATSVAAINKLYSIKDRNEHKPVAICLSEVSQVQTWAKIEHLPPGLLENLFPGPVTLILTCASKLDKSLSCAGKVGIRIPDYPFIRSVAKKLERPIALTSANVSSEPSSLTVDEFKLLWGKLGAVFDGGHLGDNDLKRRASTVVDLSIKGYFKIIREGIAFNKTIEILQRFHINRD